MIITFPLKIAVWLTLADGAFVTFVAVQLFVPGLYLPPVFK